MKWQDLSKKKKLYISVFATILGIMLWAFISAGLITHNFNRSQLSVDSDKQEALINGIILTETKDEVKYWELYGETGTYDSSNGVAMMDNVVGNFYKDNEVAMSFQASKGSYDAEKKLITLSQNIFIAMKDGTTLKADHLRYPNSDEPIEATGHIIITRGKEFLATAEKVQISNDYNKFKIIGKTTTKIFDRR